MNDSGKTVLAVALVAGAAWIVLRSRSAAAAAAPPPTDEPDNGDVFDMCNKVSGAIVGTKIPLAKHAPNMICEVNRWAYEGAKKLVELAAPVGKAVGKGAAAAGKAVAGVAAGGAKAVAGAAGDVAAGVGNLFSHECDWRAPTKSELAAMESTNRKLNGTCRAVTDSWQWCNCPHKVSSPRLYQSSTRAGTVCISFANGCSPLGWVPARAACAPGTVLYGQRISSYQAGGKVGNSARDQNVANQIGKLGRPWTDWLSVQAGERRTGSTVGKGKA